MRPIILNAAAFMTLLSATMPVFAGPGFEPGVYAEVIGGRTSVTSKYAANGNDLSLGAGLGYQYTPNFGFEVYTRSLSFIPIVALVSPAGYYPDQHSGIAAIATVSLNENFSLSGRAGADRTSMVGNRPNLSDRTDTDAVLGLGVHYAFTRNFSMSLEGTHLSKSEVSIYSIGARYKF